jgi:hypothetical protein
MKLPKIILGLLVAVMFFGTDSVGQVKADVFNLDIHCLCINTATQTVSSGLIIPPHASAVFHLTGVDTTLANSVVDGNYVYAGNSYVDLTTTTGVVHTVEVPFALFAWTNYYGTDLVAGIEFDSETIYGDPGVFAGAKVSADFAFNTSADYAKLFDNINANGDVFSNNIEGNPVHGVGWNPKTFEMFAASGSLTLALSGCVFTNGVFAFNVTGPAGSNVVVQASTNLQNWIPLATNTLASGTNYFSDLTFTNYSKRFYRVRSQ